MVSIIKVMSYCPTLFVTNNSPVPAGIVGSGVGVIVAVGGTAVAVGIAVDVGGIGVAVGAEVDVGATVAVGATGVAVVGTAVGLGSAVAVGVGTGG